MKSKTMKSKTHAMRKICSLTFVGSVAALLVTQVANGDTITWNADATSTSWVLGSNWIDGVAPVAGDDVVVFGRSAGGTFAPSNATGYAAVNLNSLTFTDGPDGAVALTLIDSTLQIGAGGLNKTSTANLFMRGLTLSSDQTWTGVGSAFIDGAITGSKLNADTQFIRFDNNSPGWSAGLDVRRTVGMGNNNNFAVGATNTPFGTGTITLINQRNDGVTSSNPILQVSGRSTNIDTATAQTIPNNIALSNLGAGFFTIQQGGDTTSGAQRNFVFSGVISGNIGDKGVVFGNPLGAATPARFILSGNNTYTANWAEVGSNVTLEVGNGGTTGTLGNGAAIIKSGAVLAFNRSDNLSVGNVITSGGAVQQIGNGTTTLTANNDYTGATTVSAGTLLINGNQSAANGTVTVGSGATFGGGGIIGGNVNVSVGGTISPGNSAGNLTLNNGLTLSGSYLWELGALSTSNPGSDFDVITITAGNADITGAALELNLGSFAPSAVPFWQTNQTWAGILNNTGAGSLTGAFAISTDQTPWASLGTFSTTTTFGSNDVDLVWVAIPEPTSISFLMGGLGVLFLLRRRRGV